VHAEFEKPAALPGPTGERNELTMQERGPLLCMAAPGDGSVGALMAQVGASLATGNRTIVWYPENGVAEKVAALFIKTGVAKDAVTVVQPGSNATLGDLVGAKGLEAVALAGPVELAIAINRELATADAPIRPVICFREDAGSDIGAGQPLAGSPHYLHRFVHERSLSIDTTASGGNASLLSIGDGSSSSPGEV